VPRRGKRTSQKHTPSSATPPAKENDRKESWWKTLLQHPTVVIVSVLITLLGISVQRWWTAFEENTKLRSQLELAQEQVGRQSSELEILRKKNEALASLYPILQFYGTRAKIIRSFDLKKEVGSTLTIGNCSQPPCFVFTMREIKDDKAYLGLKGAWEGISSLPIDIITFGLPLKKGCQKKFRMSKYEVDFVIEDDRHLDLRAGIAISAASSLTPGVQEIQAGCP